MPAKTCPSVGKALAPLSLPDLPGDLHDALRHDIARRGVLVPIVVDAATGEVVDGRIRQAIAKDLGIREVPTIFLGKLTEEDRTEIRNSLNYYRRHLSRAQLQAILIGEVRSTPGDSDRKIAGRVGVSPTTVGAARRMAGVQVGQPDSKRTGRDGKRYSSRKPSVYTATRGQTEVVRRHLESLGDEAPDGAMTPRMLRKLVGRKERAELCSRSVDLPSTFSVKCCDFRENGIKSGTITLAYVDPPWGTGWKGHRRDFADENYRILRPGGLAVCYFGQTQMVEMIDVFRDAGFTYRWVIACVNDDDSGACSHYGSLLASWRSVVVLQKGGPRFKTSHLMSDVLRTKDRDKTRHPWQQSLSEAVSLIRGLSPNGASIADLTCCTGTSGVACAQIGSRRFHGVEVEEDLCRMARSRIAEALRTG